MATIQHISGKYESALSQPSLKWVLTADEVSLFEVPEWIPSTVDNPKKITWALKDNARTTTFETQNGTVLEKLSLSISKKYSGSYGYYLEAKLDGTTETAGTFILGHCETKVTTANWTGPVATGLRYGDPVNVHLETEGLNGNRLVIEVYAKKNNQLVSSYNQECINGEVDFIMTDTYVWKAFVCMSREEEEQQSKECTEPEEFYIKVKNKADSAYVKNGAGKEEVMNLTLQGEVLPKPEKPTNITPAKIGKPDKSPVVTGIIELKKIAVKTTYDVCNDGVKDFNDEENFWALENNNKYYHWLERSLRNVNPLNNKKPDSIPITFASNDKFSFTATFKTIFSVDNLKIRVRDKDNRYTFANEPHVKKAKDEEFEVDFESDNTPYKDTVQFLPDFELIFECSFDEKSWTPLGSVPFWFYITWQKPQWSSFQNAVAPEGTMKIRFNKNIDPGTGLGKPNIIESLLWLSCSYAKDFGNTESTFEKNQEKILDATFKAFEAPALKVVRAREGKTRPDGTAYLSTNWSAAGLGYWRDQSATTGTGLDTARGVIGDNSLKYLLSYGEARCGEWDLLFQHLSLCHNIKTKSFAIFTGADPRGASSGLSSQIFLVKSTSGWDLRDPKAPKEKSPVGNKAQGNTAPLHFFQDHVFTIFEAASEMKFYDASYGVKSSSFFNDPRILLSSYSNGLNGVIYATTFTGSPADEPEHHFKFDLHVKADVFGVAYDNKTEVSNMENHLVISII